MKDGSRASIRRHSSQNDANRPLLLALAAIIVTVLLVTIATELSAPGKPQASLIVITLMLAWLFANMIYTLHYAHLYHGNDKGKSGLVFPGTSEPDYWDFAYFAFTLGMTFQTSDVEITLPEMRRAARRRARSHGAQGKKRRGVDAALRPPLDAHRVALRLRRLGQA